MKVSTRVDDWGGMSITLQGETAHENTLLRILGRKSISHSILDGVETTEGGRTELSIHYFAHEQTKLPEKAALTAAD